MSTYPKTTIIKDLCVFPIKSCRGISVKSSVLTREGLQYDRRFMFIDVKNVFITIREKPQMTLIKTAIEHDAEDKPYLKVTFPEVIKTDGGDPQVDYEKATTISVPLEPDQAWLDTNTELVDVEIWKLETDAYAIKSDIADVVDRYFTSWDSDAKVRLVMKGPTPRICRGNGAEEHLGREQSTFFSDVLPATVATESSLRELNSRLSQAGADAITIERFRQNIIVDSDNLAPWEEDEWRTLRVNPPKSMMGSLATITGVGSQSIDIDVVARCARCHVPNVDPDTAVPDKKEPWGTLYKYRRTDPGVSYKPCFGMLCCPRSEGPIEVGMEIEIREVTQAAGGRGEPHRYVKGF